MIEENAPDEVLNQGDQSEGKPDSNDQPEQVDTIADALEPVLGWEQQNVEFWVQILQLVVLILILREVSR